MTEHTASAERAHLDLKQIISALRTEGIEAFSPFIDTRIMSAEDFEEMGTIDHLTPTDFVLQLLGSMRTATFAAALADHTGIEAADVYEDIEALYAEVQVRYSAEQALVIKEEIDRLTKALDEHKVVLRGALSTGTTHRLGQAEILVKESKELSESLLLSMLSDEDKEHVYVRKFSAPEARKYLKKVNKEQLISRAETPKTASVVISRHIDAE